jgi:hypothetical protein
LANADPSGRRCSQQREKQLRLNSMPEGPRRYDARAIGGRQIARRREHSKNKKVWTRFEPVKIDSRLKIANAMRALRAVRQVRQASSDKPSDRHAAVGAVEGQAERGSAPRPL